VGDLNSLQRIDILHKVLLLILCYIYSEMRRFFARAGWVHGES